MSRVTLAGLRLSANRKPRKWNVVRSQYLGRGEYLDKVIRRNLTEEQAIILCRRLERRTGDLWYSGETVGRTRSVLLA